VSVERRGDAFRLRLQHRERKVRATFASLAEAEAYAARWKLAAIAGSPAPDPPHSWPSWPLPGPW